MGLPEDAATDDNTEEIDADTSPSPCPDASPCPGPVPSPCPCSDSRRAARMNKLKGTGARGTGAREVGVDSLAAAAFTPGRSFSNNSNRISASAC